MEIKPIIRDSNGLIEGVNYIQALDGRIDWRKMVKSEYLVPNKQLFEKQGKPTPTTIEGLQDRELLILLGGIKDIANLRGYTSVNYSITSPSADAVFVVCQICWAANFETEGRLICSSGIGDAHPKNTNALGAMYLGAIAENRAFVRCVRNFLRINVVGEAEVSDTKTEDSTEPAIPDASVYGQIERLMIEKNVSFSLLKSKMVSMGIEGAKEFKGMLQIPKERTFEIIAALKERGA